MFFERGWRLINGSNHWDRISWLELNFSYDSLLWTVIVSSLTLSIELPYLTELTNEQQELHSCLTYFHPTPGVVVFLLQSWHLSHDLQTHSVEGSLCGGTCNIPSTVTQIQDNPSSKDFPFNATTIPLLLQCMISLPFPISNGPWGSLVQI